MNLLAFLLRPVRVRPWMAWLWWSLAAMLLAVACLTGCSLAYVTGSVEKTRIATDDTYASLCEVPSKAACCHALYEARLSAAAHITAARGSSGASPLRAAGSASDLKKLLKADRKAIRVAAGTCAVAH